MCGIQIVVCAEYKLSDADMKGKGLHVGVIFANCMLLCMQVFYPWVAYYLKTSISNAYKPITYRSKY